MSELSRSKEMRKEAEISIPQNSNSLHERLSERTRELRVSGLNWRHAHGISWLEERIRQWPPAWGDDLKILIYGDFKPIDEPMDVDSLGIYIQQENIQKSVIKGAKTVHEAIVKVEDKSIPSLVDAARRINVLLGSYTLVEWGNVYCGWWSWVTHDSGGGVGTSLSHEDLPKTMEGVLRLTDEARRRIDAALYWVRVPREALVNFYRSNVLQVFSAYWNAFECLVEAVESLRPRKKLTRNEKEELITDLFERSGKKLNADFVEKAYREIVNPGFKAKATHALEICFGENATHYIQECFELSDENNRLYNIRNSINHGEVDAENPEELIRIDSRLSQLWIIIWGMFGRMIPFPAPLDPNLESDKQTTS